MKQRLFAFVLCFAMVLSMCTVFSFGAAAEEMTASGTPSEWNGANAGEKPSGSGTADDPVIIASAANLAYWRVNDEELYLNAYIELHTDINLANHNWGGMNFKGHFDGKGHTIYNLKQTTTGRSGLFLYLGGTVENLKIVNANITSSGNYAGLLAGETSAAVTVNNCEFYNCSVKGNSYVSAFIARTKSYAITAKNIFLDENCSVTTTSGSCAAGMVAYITTGALLSFTNCTTYASIKSETEEAAGFIANLTQSSATFTNCFNYGAIEATSNKAAGFVSFKKDNYNTVTFINCANYGTVKAKADAAGFVAYINMQANKAEIVKNSANYGTITATEGNAGGFIATSTGGGIAVRVDGFMSLGNVLSGDEKSPHFAYTWQDRAKTSSTESRYGYIKHFYYLEGGVFDVSQTKGNTKKTNVGVYDGNTMATLNGLVGADVALVEWKMALLPDGITTYPQLSNAPHLQNAEEPEGPNEGGSEITKYTVTFLGKDGAVLEEYLLSAEEIPVIPEAPALDGFDFIGWTDVATGEIVDVSTLEIVADMTLQATYEEKEIYFGGYGTAEAPYLIGSKEDLFAMAAKINDEATAADFVNAVYRLMADIDLAGETWTSIGTFSGTIQGNGKTISNFAKAFISLATGTVTIDQLTISGAKSPLISDSQSCTLTVTDCHVKDGDIYGGNIAFFLATARQTTATFTNCTVSGVLTGNSTSGSVGGFIGHHNEYKLHVTFTNCTSSVTIKGSDRGAGGFIGAARYDDGKFTFNGCVFNGNINTSGNAGGFIGLLRKTHVVAFDQCSVFGSVAAGSYAGGFIGGRQDTGKVTIAINNCGMYASLNANCTGGITAKAYENVTASNSIILATDLFGEATDGASLTNVYTTIASLKALPEGLDSSVWGIGTLPVTSGISVTLGDSIVLNVYAKRTVVLKAHAAQGLYVNGAFVTGGEDATVGGVAYTKYVFDSFTPADFDKVFAFAFAENAITQKTYSIINYLVNTYKNYASDANLTALIEALALYGNAMQMAKEQTPTVLASFTSATEATISDTYLAEKFASVHFKTNNTSAEGMGINLYGTIAPIFYVADGITKVEVEIYGETTTIEVVEGVAQFYGLNATSLNNTMQVTFYAGDEVVSTQRTSVACYIETALATEGFLSDGEAVLAQALAVYMRAARDYMGLN